MTDFAVAAGGNYVADRHYVAHRQSPATNRKTAKARHPDTAVAPDQRRKGDRMKRNAGHLRAGLRRRVGADAPRRSTRRTFLLVNQVIE